MTAQKKEIRCNSTSKLLAKYDGEVIYIWCKECKTEHKILLRNLHQQVTEVK